MEPQYEEQFTAFIDFLGFEEFSRKPDDDTRAKVLELLVALSQSRGEFIIESRAEGPGLSSASRPAISTFSDHIVVSFPLKPMLMEGAFNEGTVALIILNQFTMLVTSIAVEALRIGFLIRGGATIGKLYHAGGVVFGEAMVEAYRLESSTSVYPRVVLSPKITERSGWMEKAVNVAEDDDGLYHVDYFQMMLPQAARSGTDSAKAWYREAVSVVSTNLATLKESGNVNVLAKWTWFSRQFRKGLETLQERAPEYFELLAGSLDENPWL